MSSVAVAVHAWRTGNFVVQSSKGAVLETEVSARASVLILVVVGRSHKVTGCLLTVLSA